MTPAHIQQLQDLFQVEPDGPITLRAIRKPGPAINLNFHAKEFPTVEERWAAFAVEAGKLNEAGYNIYTCLNPIKPEFAGDAVKDADIACRKLLLVDLDRANAKEAPATDDEIQRALEVADKIEAWFRDREGEASTRVLSGNGIHLYYRLDSLPNDKTSQDACQSLLLELAAQFDTPEVHIDKVVHNASRITKVPGTVAYKGAASEERPYRKAVFL